jgi:hypothetical protein
LADIIFVFREGHRKQSYQVKKVIVSRSNSIECNC